MDLRDVVRALRTGWWLIVVVAVLGVAAGVAINVTTPPTYQSTVEFFVSTPSTTTNGANAANEFATQRVNSYVRVLSSEMFARRVIETTGVNVSVDSLTHKIVGSADLNTVLLTATVSDSSASRSLQIAQGVASDFPQTVDALDNKSSNTVILNVVSGPTLHRAPVSPKKKLNIATGLLIGLALGMAIAILRRLLDTTVHDSDALRAEFDIPVIGSIGLDAAAKKEPLIVDEQARSVRAEAFRQLRTNLRFSDVDTPVQVIVVTSSVAFEGKSSTATNLALVFAEAGNRVLIIEADLRRPRVTEYLTMEREVGLTNVLAGQIDVADALQQWGTSSMQVLPSGSIPPNPSELLGSHNMAALMTRLRADFDIIVVDTPPLLPVTDAAVAAPLSDGVVLVVRHGKTSRAQVESSVAALRAVDARILGFALNMVPRRASSAGRYDGYGRYEEDATAKNVAKRDTSDRSTEADLTDQLLLDLPAEQARATSSAEGPAVSAAARHSRSEDDLRSAREPRRQPEPDRVTTDTEAVVDAKPFERDDADDLVPAGAYVNGSHATNDRAEQAFELWSKSPVRVARSLGGPGLRDSRRRSRSGAADTHSHLAGQRRR